MTEAAFYETQNENTVQCCLCAHECVIQPGRRGICKVRENQDGKLISLNYGRLIAANVDPIEKKPLYHYMPGSQAFSIAAPGCNLRCDWCQNWQISQADARFDYNRLPITQPEAIVRQALETGCASIAYTYTEPTVFYEFTRDTAVLAKEAGLRNIYVSNGYMSQTVITEMIAWLDAANIDLKAFSDGVYHKLTGAHLEPVLESCRALRKAGVWLEITTLLIPGVNDDETQLREMASFVAEELGPDTPWHLSRYFPQYRSTAPVTPLSSLELAEQIGREVGLHFIYPGNLHGRVETRCPSCGHTLISRQDYDLQKFDIVNGACPSCQTKIAGVWSSD